VEAVEKREQVGLLIHQHRLATKDISAVAVIVGSLEGLFVGHVVLPRTKLGSPRISLLKTRLVFHPANSSNPTAIFSIAPKDFRMTQVRSGAAVNIEVDCRMAQWTVARFSAK
jgi:hypothetical protein